MLEFLFFLYIEALLFEFCVRVFFLKIPLGDKGLHRRARTMRMVKIQRKQLTLEEAVPKSLLVKEAQYTREETMQDYRSCLNRFVSSSHNSIEYPVLESDVITLT